MSLKVDLRVGEELRLDGGRIIVTLLEKSGQRARISVEADESVIIQPPGRREVAPGAQKMLAGKL